MLLINNHDLLIHQHKQIKILNRIKMNLLRNLNRKRKELNKDNKRKLLKNAFHSTGSGEMQSYLNLTKEWKKLKNLLRSTTFSSQVTKFASNSSDI